MENKKKVVSLAKRRPPKPGPEHHRKAEKAQSIFEMMQVLSAAQRQRFGEIRRKWRSVPGIKEKVEEIGEGRWAIRYYKGKKKLAEARLLPQDLHYETY